jgi:hypothetical protein
MRTHDFGFYHGKNKQRKSKQGLKQLFEYIDANPEENFRFFDGVDDTSRMLLEGELRVSEATENEYQTFDSSFISQIDIIPFDGDLTEERVVISFIINQPIEEGDPNEIAERLVIREMFKNIPLDEIQIELLLPDFAWQRFSKEENVSETGKVVKANVYKSKWIELLRSIFKNNTLCQKIISTYADSAMNAGLAGLYKLNEITYKVSSMTEFEFEVYMKQGETSFDIMKVDTSTIDEFQKTKDEQLRNEENIEGYLLSQLSFNHSELRKLAEKLNTLSVDEYQQLKKSINLSFPLGIFKTKAEYDDTKQKFDQLFKDYALGKAFDLLNKNEEILTKEQKRYQDDTAIDQLITAFTEGSIPAIYNESAKLRATGFYRFNQDFDTDNKFLAPFWKGLSEKELEEAFAQSTTSELDFYTRNLFSYFDPRKTSNPGYVKKKQLSKGINKLKNKDQALASKMQQLWDEGIAKGYVLSNDVYQPEWLMREVVYAHYPEIIEAWNKERLAPLNADGGNLLKQFPFLANMANPSRGESDFHDWYLRYKVKKHITKDELREEIRESISLKIANAKESREELINDPEKVFRLQKLIPELLNDELLIDANTTAGNIVQDAIGQYQQDELIYNAVLGAITLVSSIIAVFVPELYGAILMGISTTAGVSMGYTIYTDYKFDLVTSNTGLDKELNNANPNVIPVVLGILSILPDAYLFLSTSLRVVSRMVNLLNAASELNALRKSLSTIYDDLATHPQWAAQFQSLNKEAFITRFEKSWKEAADLNRTDPNFINFYGQYPIASSLSIYARGGFQRIYQFDEELLSKILTQIKNPVALERLSLHILVNPDFTSVVARLFTEYGDDAARILLRLTTINRNQLVNLERILNYMPESMPIAYKVERLDSLDFYDDIVQRLELFEKATPADFPLLAAKYPELINDTASFAMVRRLYSNGFTDADLAKIIEVMGSKAIGTKYRKEYSLLLLDSLSIINPSEVNVVKTLLLSENNGLIAKTSYAMHVTNIRNQWLNFDYNYSRIFNPEQTPINPVLSSSKNQFDNSFSSFQIFDELQNSEGITVREITVNELNQLKKIREVSQLDEFQNIAEADIYVNVDIPKTNFKACSGYDSGKSLITDGSPSVSASESIFETTSAPTKSGAMRPRSNDSEAKIFEQIAKMLGANKQSVKTQIFYHIKGRIFIKSELTPCGSCSRVIQQFKQLFPEIEIEIAAQPIISFK